MKDILFTDTLGVDKKYNPQPSSSLIPQWYKDTNSYIDNKKKIKDDNGTPATIKKCMPVFDAISAGYIISTYVDIQVSQENDGPYYRWPSFDPVHFHSKEQAINHPQSNDSGYPKLINPWGVKTPKGYSCLFISPMHRENSIITILPGIVDTDMYCQPVNLPFILNDPNWEGIIPAGTPVAQIIPFKRDEFKMKFGSEKELNEIKKMNVSLTSLWFNRYKRLFWSKKLFK